MIISGFDKLTLTNYPHKVACTIFTNGCNFACPYCQNGTLALAQEQNRINPNEILQYLKLRKNIIDGICISGGEPTIHKDLKDFIKEIKKIGTLVKLDTNGSHPEVLKELLKENLLDYIAMDIKMPLDDYEEITGVRPNISKLKQSIKIIKNSKIEHEFRTTIIKEFHTPKEIEKILTYVGNSPYYLQNFIDSDNVIKKGLHGFSEKELKEIDKKIKQKYPNAQMRGLKI